MQQFVQIAGVPVPLPGAVAVFKKLIEIDPDGAKFPDKRVVVWDFAVCLRQPRPPSRRNISSRCELADGRRAGLRGPGFKLGVFGRRKLRRPYDGAFFAGIVLLVTRHRSWPPARGRDS